MTAPLLFLSLATFMLLVPLPALHAVPLEAGQPFPIVRLPLCRDSSDTTTIEEFRGRKLMLHLFASW